MFAIVEIAGQQFKVAKDQKVFVHRLDAKTGDKVSFDQVFMLADGDKISVGAPAVANASVEAKVVRHLKDDKVIVFKKKRRKGYRVKNGHRQSLTEIAIEYVGVGKVKKTAPKAKAEVDVVELLPAPALPVFKLPTSVHTDPFQVSAEFSPGSPPAIIPAPSVAPIAAIKYLEFGGDAVFIAGLAVKVVPLKTCVFERAVGPPAIIADVCVPKPLCP